MQHRIQTVIDIAASAGQVWSILTDFPAYPQWNPFITSVEGKLALGARLKVVIAPPGGKPMTFRPVILNAARAHELRWRGRLFLPGLFDGEHSFRLEQRATVCRFHHSETFSGALVSLLGGKVFDATQRGFEDMNLALKARAEAA